MGGLHLVPSGRWDYCVSLDTRSETLQVQQIHCLEPLVEGKAPGQIWQNNMMKELIVLISHLDLV